MDKRHSLSDPRFDRRRLHGHAEMDRKAAGHHSFPHLPKLPETHPQHLEAIEPAAIRDQRDAWMAIWHLRFPKKPEKAMLFSEMEVEQEISRGAQERLVPWSVVAVELVVTMVVLNFGVVSYWSGSWRLLDLSFAAWFGEEQWKSIVVLLGLGVSIQVLAVITGRLFLAKLIYRAARRPRTWGEVVWRTVADRSVQYVMSWAAICIWKALWDVWDVYILPDQPWISCVAAHVSGLVVLLSCSRFALLSCLQWFLWKIQSCLIQLVHVGMC